jgi:hypothetical protein
MRELVKRSMIGSDGPAARLEPRMLAKEVAAMADYQRLDEIAVGRGGQS